MDNLLSARIVSVDFSELASDDLTALGDRALKARATDPSERRFAGQLSAFAPYRSPLTAVCGQRPRTASSLSPAAARRGDRCPTQLASWWATAAWPLSTLSAPPLTDRTTERLERSSCRGLDGGKGESVITGRRSVSGRRTVDKKRPDRPPTSAKTLLVSIFEIADTR